MHKPQEQVREMHAAFGDMPTSPAEPMVRNAELRARLILEEAMETAAALLGANGAILMVADVFATESSKWPLKPNLELAIDGCCDVLVVTYGTFEDIGIDAEPFFDEVNCTNMAKLGGERRADGKRLKPVGWKPPRIAELLDLVTREWTARDGK